MSPRRIHQTAKTKLLSFEERMLQRRIRHLLPGWQLDIWDDHDNARLVAELLPQYFDAYSCIRFGVAKADIARLCFLVRYGGFYLDTDYKLLRPFGEDLLEQTCILPVSRSGDTHSAEFRVCNSILASEADHPFFRMFLKDLFEGGGLDTLTEDTIEKVTGPEALSEFFLKNLTSFSDIYLPQRNDFHPLIIYKGLTWERGHNSYGAHLCWGSWRSKDIARSIKTSIVRKITCF